MTSYSSFKTLTCSKAEALLLFCNALHLEAFHPKAFRIAIEEKVHLECPRTVTRFFARARNIETMLVETYAVALNKHKALNPHGFLPKRIIFGHQFQRHFLQWRTQGGTIITLTSISQKLHLNLHSFSEKEAQRYALKMELPTPKQQLYVPKVSSVETLPNNWRDVKIPLGDIIDFINKYR